MTMLDGAATSRTGTPNPAPPSSGGLGGALKLLSDPSRMRILALLETEELSVGDLSRALDLSQSRVSNHLRLLRESELLRERHAGTSTFLRMRREGGGLVGRIWRSLREEVLGMPEHQADRVRLDSVLAERRGGEEELFDRLAREWDKNAGSFETGLARERAAVHLLPEGITVADLGCGTGYMGRSVLGNCVRLVCVDRSEEMLAEARRRLGRVARSTELEFRRGELDALPLDDGEVDACLCGMVLHHLPELDAGLTEVHRVLRPGGTLAVLELAPHREEWMRAELGDRHLGLEPADVLAALGRAGFTDLVLDPVEDRYRPPRPDPGPEAKDIALSLYIVRGRKPAASPHDKNR